MPYYLLKNASSPEKIGRNYPQSIKMSEGYPYNDPHSVRQIRNEWLFFTPNLDAYVLNGRSKKTDVISVMSPVTKNNIVIKVGLAKIWKDFNSCDSQQFPATVLYRNQKLDYSLLHFYTYHNQFIDFKKSNFYHGFRRVEKVKDLKINSHEDYHAAKAAIEKETQFDPYLNTHQICPYNIAIDEEKADLDFFLLKDMYKFNYIVSERFKEALVNKKVTGIDLINLDEYRNEPKYKYESK